MYSSRRRYPYYRKRKYNSSRKKIFSPNLFTSNIPSYYQMKGRTVQQSPRLMYNPPTEMPSSKTLQKMYDTLLKAKYPNVGPQILPLKPYVIEHETTINIISDNTDSKFSPLDLLTTIQSKLTPLPSTWRYKIECFNINFQASQGSGTSSPVQYHLDLYHPILTEQTNPIQLIYKTVTTSAFGPVQWNANLTPTQINQLRYTRASYTTGGIAFTQPVVATLDDNITDNGWYPILSTEYDPQQNYLECVINSGVLGYNPIIAFSVLCTPVQD